MHHAERSLFDLRRGRIICISGPTGSGTTPPSILLAAVEGLHAETLEQLRRLGTGSLRLVLTGHRGSAMGLSGPPATRLPGTNGSRALPDLSLLLNGERSPARIMDLSSGTGSPAASGRDLRPASPLESGALTLMRLGRLLPAAVIVDADPVNTPELRRLAGTGAILDVPFQEIRALAANPGIRVRYVSEAPVPLEEAANAHFILFRETSGLDEHVAILIGERKGWPEPVPVRLHSACLTGDLFGSLRCDCGEQLRQSIRTFAQAGGGVLLYLGQEGRSIGLGNKLRAYSIQGEGLDTVDADCTLGFGADERRYDVAVQMLQHVGVQRIRLFTNNPEKLRALEEAGIQVVDREPLHGVLTPENLPYVRAKVERAGHWLQGMLDGGFEEDREP